MLRQYVVIPVYWGQSFLPDQHGSFSWLDMNGAILTIMNGPYMDALQEYGVGHSLFHPTADVAPGELAVGTHFTNAQIESLLVSEIDAGRAPRPDVFDQGVIPFYVVFLRQGLFSQDDPAAVGLHWTFTYQNVQSPCAWVMQGDNLDGTTPIFTHELAEATALQEVGDDCLGSQGRLDGIMVQGFFSKVQNACIIPTDGPRWHSWFRIGDPFPASTFDMTTPVEAVLGPTNHLDLFSIGNDQGVWSNFWDGQWHSWFRIGDPFPASTFDIRTPVEAVIGPTGHLDLFVMGNDLGVWSNFWDGQWHSWFRIGDPAPSSTFNMATPVEALVGPTNHLDLFAVGNDGGVWSNFWGNE